MEKSKRTFRGSYPAYALTYFFFYWSLGVFTSVLSMYLTGIGKSKAEMSFIMSASSLFGVVLIPIVGYINDKLRKPRLICTVMMACVAVFGILFALVRETMLLFLLNGCIMGFISSLSPVSERMATSTKYRYGTIRIWGTFGYAAAVQVACAMMEFTSPQLIFVSVSVSAVLAIVGFLFLFRSPFRRCWPLWVSSARTTFRLRIRKRQRLRRASSFHFSVRRCTFCSSSSGLFFRVAQIST